MSTTTRARRTASGIALLAVVLTAAGCGGTSTAASTDPDPQVIRAGFLTVCTSLPYEPFEFERNGETVGFEIDLAKAALIRVTEYALEHLTRNLTVGAS